MIACSSLTVNPLLFNFSESSSILDSQTIAPRSAAVICEFAFTGKLSGEIEVSCWRGNEPFVDAAGAAAAAAGAAAAAAAGRAAAAAADDDDDDADVVCGAAVKDDAAAGGGVGALLLFPLPTPFPLCEVVFV